MSKKNDGQDVLARLQEAVDDGTLSEASRSVLTGDLGEVMVAGAAGKALEDIVASDVTLITLLVDASSSITARGLEEAIREGHALLVDALSGTKERDSVLLATWTFNDAMDVVHSYVGVDDAVRLDDKNYRGTGSTRLYDVWCDGLGANVAYAQRLRAGGTPCRSVVVVLTDGEDTSSRRNVADCARLSKDLLASEQFVLAFVGVGDDVDFHAVAKSMGIPDGCVAVQQNATATALRGVFQMVSRSAIRVSQARVQPGAAAGFFV